MILIVQSYPIKKHIMYNHIYGMPEILNEHYYLSVIKFLLRGLPCRKNLFMYPKYFITFYEI